MMSRPDASVEHLRNHLLSLALTLRDRTRGTTEETAGVLRFVATELERVRDDADGIAKDFEAEAESERAA